MLLDNTSCAYAPVLMDIYLLCALATCIVLRQFSEPNIYHRTPFELCSFLNVVLYSGELEIMKHAKAVRCISYYHNRHHGV